MLQRRGVQPDANILINPSQVQEVAGSSPGGRHYSFRTRAFEYVGEPTGTAVGDDGNSGAITGGRYRFKAAT